MTGHCCPCCTEEAWTDWGMLLWTEQSAHCNGDRASQGPASAFHNSGSHIDHGRVGGLCIGWWRRLVLSFRCHLQHKHGMCCEQNLLSSLVVRGIGYDKVLVTCQACNSNPTLISDALLKPSRHGSPYTMYGFAEDHEAGVKHSRLTSG